MAGVLPESISGQLMANLLRTYYPLLIKAVLTEAQKTTADMKSAVFYNPIFLNILSGIALITHIIPNQNQGV